MSSEDEITINDLIGELNETNDFGDLKKMAQSTPEPYKETSQVAQARANRHAAFEQVKESVDSWNVVVSERDRERTITFGEEEKGRKYQQFKPVKTELANTVEKILDEQKLTPKSQLTLEQDAMAQLSEKEIRERVEQLAQLRHLQFRNEMKARRWKKIKSKAFRRLHKKDMAELPLEELAEVDPEAFKARLAKIEADRAKERVTLRHKNTSAWVKRVLQRGLKAASDDVRKSYEEQIRLGEELTKKILLKAQEEGDEEEEIPENPIAETPALKGLAEMKFMKDAAERRRAEQEELERQLAGEEPPADNIPATGIVNVSAKIIEEKAEKESLSGQEPPKPTMGEKLLAEKRGEAKSDAIEEAKSDEKVTPKKEVTTTTPKANPWTRRAKKNTRIVSANVLAAPVTDEDLAAGGVDFARKEGQAEEIAKMLGFEDEFNKQKQEEAMKEAGEGLVSMDELHMAGWGSWTGAGAVETEGAKRRRERLERERQAVIDKAVAERKDANLDGVILSEKADTAVEKYHMGDLPYGYTNAKQVKAFQSFPIGPEFNSRTGFAALTAPNMVSKAGKPIDPIFMTKMKRRKERIDRMKQNRKALESSNTLQ